MYIISVQLVNYPHGYDIEHTYMMWICCAYLLRSLETGIWFKPETR